MTEHDIAHLREVIAVAWIARRHGNHPFGAILVDTSGLALLRCREVFARSTHPMIVIGPALEDEALVVHASFWR